jgi:hypothetical protein
MRSAFRSWSKLERLEFRNSQDMCEPRFSRFRNAYDYTITSVEDLTIASPVRCDWADAWKADFEEDAQEDARLLWPLLELANQENIKATVVCSVVAQRDEFCCTRDRSDTVMVS